jgi:predicted NBD/HSP70 family sugar kinase
VLRLLWRQGALSRWELHERSGLTPNAAGAAVAELLRAGVVRACAAEKSAAGRPRVPLEIDPGRRQVAGVALAAGGVEVCRLSLTGAMVGDLARREVKDPRRLVPTAARLLAGQLDRDVLAVGVSVSGLVDGAGLGSPCILPSSAVSGRRPVALGALLAAAGRPLALVNDMHALAIRWLLTHRVPTEEDTLLVSFADGALGAAMLIGGRPNTGSVMAGNELGHTRLAVQTERCYCGHTGCLERICSTGFVRGHGGPAERTLDDVVATVPEHPALRRMLGLLALGIANAVNFVRPRRLVLVSQWTRSEAVCTYLLAQVRALTLTELAARTRIDLWDQPAGHGAETAAWAALAPLYSDAWVAPAGPRAAGLRL